MTKNGPAGAQLSSLREAMEPDRRQRLQSSNSWPATVPASNWPSMAPVALEPRLPPASEAAADAPALKLVVKGLKSIERQLLNGIVRVSQYRKPSLSLLEEVFAKLADVVVVDTQDAAAMAWAHSQPWLAEKTVIWIDGSSVAHGHIAVKRPVAWPALPMIIARALESGSALNIRPSIPLAALPVALRAPGLALVPVPPPSILVVDDSLAVRAYLRSLLEARGFVVTEAVQVHAALVCVTQARFDCILMDVLMPGLDGYDGCRQIKSKLRGAQAVPIVMLTSKSSPFDRIRGKMAGCDAYLTKPVDPAQLQEVLARVVQTSQQRQSASAQ
jgi:two-component system, cell cycle response regulator